MKSKAAVLLVVTGLLALAGAALGTVVAPVWSSARARQPALQATSAVAAAGQGVSLALLGGFRALVADGTWIRMYALWEKRDLAATETLLHVVTAIDPRPIYFWLNGARILAYDLPAWRIQAAGGYDAVSAPEQSKINQAKHGQLALRHLDSALRIHPESADIWIERANIELTRLHDVAGAAESYRRAWELPKAPYFAARLHAELLRRIGRNAEALAWLRQLHPKLPPTDEAAGAAVVLERIRDLERELRIPAESAYRPSQ